MKETNKNTEQLILEAAVREFSAKGFDGARTAAIAAEAGVTHTMLHYYFRTKEKLFERIFKEKVECILDIIIAPVVQSGGSIKDKIRMVTEAHFDFLMANRELPVFFVTTLNSKPELYAEIIEMLISTADRRKGALQAELDLAAERGEIRHVDVSALLADIASLNVMPFLAYRIMMAALGYAPDKEEQFFADRKRENVEIILKRLS